MINKNQRRALDSSNYCLLAFILLSLSACDAQYQEVASPIQSTDYEIDAGQATSVVSIVAGGYHTCAILDNGALRCWGENVDGRLGYGHTDSIGDDETPASAGDVKVGGSVIQVAAGWYHTCVLLEGGSVRCFGNGSNGSLGYANTENIGDDETPADVGDVNVGGVVTQVAIGGHNTCALLDTGAMRCWGSNYYGALGYAEDITIGDDEHPSQAGDIDVGATVIQITMGENHTCALLTDGTVKCFGQGQYGALGYGNTSDIGDNEHPSSVSNVDIGATVNFIEGGYYHSCALLDSGNARCWGAAEYGRLGYGNTTTIGDNETPAIAGDIDIGGTVIDISAGELHTCAILSGGGVRCWGHAETGPLGYGNTYDIGDDEHPSSAGDVNVGGLVEQITTGRYHTCALLEDNGVRCWGYGYYGGLGYGYETFGIGDDEHPASAGDVEII